MRNWIYEIVSAAEEIILYDIFKTFKVVTSEMEFFTQREVLLEIVSFEMIRYILVPKETISQELFTIWETGIVDLENWLRLPLIIIIIIIITLFKSQIILAKHKCSTNWGDCKSNKSNKSHQSNQINQITQMLVFEERGKPEYPEKNLSEQSREPTNSVHIWRRVRESNQGHNGGRRALSPLRQPCSPRKCYLTFLNLNMEDHAYWHVYFEAKFFFFFYVTGCDSEQQSTLSLR